jgi:hypothetical protein
MCVVYIASYGTNIKYVTSIWMSNTLAVLILSMPILVKRPVYLLHLWLPIAGKLIGWAHIDILLISILCLSL